MIVLIIGGVSIKMAEHKLQLSKKLKKLLFQQNMRSSDLAKALDVPAPTIHRIVTGKSKRPHKSSLDPIAAYFNLTPEQLLGKEPLPNKKTSSGLINKSIPLIQLDEIELQHSSTKSHIIVTNVSANAFAVKNPNHSMEPLFQKDSILIFDPDVIPEDGSYILVKLQTHGMYIFRQLLLDVNKKYIKCLNPDIIAVSIQQLGNEDLIVACLVESRNCF